MDLKTVLSLPQYPGEFLHPVVYACTAVMLLCLLTSVVTYVVHQNTIRISRKGRHTLLNFCFHAALTFTVFAGGINRTKYPILCQAVSAARVLILLHDQVFICPASKGEICDHCLVYEITPEYLSRCISRRGPFNVQAPVPRPLPHVRPMVSLSTGSCQRICFPLDQLTGCSLSGKRCWSREEGWELPSHRDWGGRSTETGPPAAPPPPGKDPQMLMPRL